MAVQQGVQHCEKAPEFARPSEDYLVKRPHVYAFEAKGIEREDIDAEIEPDVARELGDGDAGMKRVCDDLLYAVVEDDPALEAM